MEYFHAKYENGDWLWYRWQDGVQIFGLGGVELPLWRHEKLATAESSTTVLFCEGERDAETAEGLGFLATSLPSGALVKGKKWSRLYTKALAKFDCIIIVEDLDEAGRQHSQTCALALSDLIADLRVVRFDELEPPKKDLTDWIAAEHTADDLRERIRKTPLWAPPPWPELKPLVAACPPEFPTEALPAPLDDFVREKASALQVPPGLVAITVMATCAAALAKKARVQIRRGWDLPLNLYVMGVAQSGDRKSPILEDCAAPMREYERRLVENTIDQVADERTRIEDLKARQQHLKGEAARAKSEVDRRTFAEEVKSIGRELARARKPVEPLLLTDNSTPEAAEILLGDQGGKLAVFSAEATPLDVTSRYNGASISNADVYLKGWGGDDLRIQRVSKDRPPIFVSKPAITLCLGLQPDALAEMMENRVFLGRGLMNRFLFAFPRSFMGMRQTDPPPDAVPDAVARAFVEAVTRLWELPGTDRVLILSPEAHKLFITMETQIEGDMRDGGRLEQIRGWAEKFKGQLGRIAGIFHLVLHRDDPNAFDIPIDRDTMWRAIAMTDFFAAHAILAFDQLGVFPATELARKALVWIRQNNLAEFSRSTLHHAKGRNLKPEAWEPALDLLVQCGTVRPKGSAAKERGKPGRPNTDAYEVNPAVHRGTGEAAS